MKGDDRIDGADQEIAPYPGARPPARRRTVSSHGVPLAVYEWGDEKAPPLLLAHGGMDVAATFDLLAPLLAAAGRRVVGWDHRGHGDSGHADLYTWDADVRDAVAVIDSITRRPLPVVGHSKGGILMVQLADALPHRVSHLVDIEGLPGLVDAETRERQRERLRWIELTRWLDHQRADPGGQRQAGTLDDLAARRGRMNPRLPHEWLRHVASQAARRDPDGWRWKFDPRLRGTVGPWRPEWTATLLHGLALPVLAVLGGVQEQMGWDATPDTVRPYLPRRARLECLDDTGHFAHVERPQVVADLVEELLS